MCNRPKRKGNFEADLGASSGAEGFMINLLIITRENLAAQAPVRL